MGKLDLISIIDVESTGLNSTTDEVIELGCVLYSLSHNCVLQQVSTLVPVSVDVNPVEHINGISAGAANSCQEKGELIFMSSQLLTCLTSVFIKLMLS